MKSIRMILTVLLLLAVALSGVAAAEKGGGKSKAPGQMRKAPFADWQENHWANEALARMSVKGVMKGYTDGTIGADRTVTKLEAAIMLVRVLGLDQVQLQPIPGNEGTASDVLYGQPESGGSGQFPGGKWEFKVDGDDMALSLKDRGQKFDVKWDDGELKISTKGPGGKQEIKLDDLGDIPEWGLSAVVTALRNDFLFWEGKRLCITCPLNRLEAAIMLVKAAGLDAAAKERAGAKLSFQDANAIPGNFRGYVALAVENGMVSGYPDGTFKPGKLVSRAEWAALLDRLDRKATVSPDTRQVQGAVTGVTTGTSPVLTMTTAAYPGGVTYPVDATAMVYINGRQGALSDVVAGDQALVQLSTDRKIMMVTVVVSRDKKQGAVAAFTAPQVTEQVSVDGNLTLRTEQDGQTQDTLLAVAATAEVWVGGTKSTFADVRIGDRVEVIVERNKVVRIGISAAATTVEGTVATVMAGTATARPRLALTAGPADGYEVADWVSIASESGTALVLTDVTAGAQVKLRLERGLIVRIVVKAAAPAANA